VKVVIKGEEENIVNAFKLEVDFPVLAVSEVLHLPVVEGLHLAFQLTPKHETAEDFTPRIT
jgi:hypothetical protein